MTQEIRKLIKSKTQTVRRQSWRSYYLDINICRVCGDMTKIGGYSIGIPQIDYKMEEKLKFRFCTKSTFSYLVNCSDMPDMRCFLTWGTKNRHGAILESFGTVEEIIILLTRLPSTTYSLLLSHLSPLLVLKSLKFPLLFDLLQSLNSLQLIIYRRFWLYCSWIVWFNF